MEFIENEYFIEGLKTFLWFTILVIVLGLILIAIRFLVKIPDFIFRKILHLVAISMITILIVVPIHWWIAEIVLGICTFGILVFLLICEHTEFYKKLYVEKYKHEILISFFVFIAVVASLIALFWGYRGDTNKYCVLIALLSWGLGDAAASIVGHTLGKHKISGKFVEGTKSVEGSIACFVLAFIISLILLIALMHVVWWLSLIEAMLIGVFVVLAELFTKKGMDTASCPLVAGFVLFLFSLIVL